MSVDKSVITVKEPLLLRLALNSSPWVTIVFILVISISLERKKTPDEQFGQWYVKAYFFTSPLFQRLVELLILSDQKDRLRHAM